MEDYDSFLVFYQKKRKQDGKTALSRTRQGIGALVEFIWKETGSSVIETDVCTYPTASVKELERVDGKLKQKGRELFWKVLEESGVELVICYGKQAFEDFFRLLEEPGSIRLLEIRRAFGRTLKEGLRCAGKNVTGRVSGMERKTDCFLCGKAFDVLWKERRFL